MLINSVIIFSQRILNIHVCPKSSVIILPFAWMIQSVLFFFCSLLKLFDSQKMISRTKEVILEVKSCFMFLQGILNVSGC